MTAASSPLVCRFAPSPTGYLHIGGARTALFNWLYARGRGGKFLLRIEDTDRARSTPEATEAIFNGLKWLGLDWDGEAVSQYSRVERHRAAARELLEKGAAYRCYSPPEEIDAAREAAKAEGRPQRFDSPWRDAKPADWPADKPWAVRIRAPREGATVIQDHVQGEVVIQNEQLDDMIILRSDGDPTYNFAVVVDDHDMGVNLVMRGVDHLTNTARQSLVYKAMGWDLPEFAHVPLIHGPDGAKFSKRHGAPAVENYRDMGYLPEAMRNYLARLGWSHGDDEFFSTAQAMEWFNLESLGKSPARFDFAKLEDLNARHIRAAEDERLVQAVEELRALRGEAPIPAGKRELLLRSMSGLKERARTLADLEDSAGYVLKDRPLDLDEKAAALLSPEAKARIARLTSLLQHVSEWTAENLESAVKDYAEAEGMKLGKIAQPLRAALTGRSVSPGVFEVMEVLGRAESLARLEAQAS
ncbi:glutamate--tRNA ligase [Neomegalonema perideroedes]|uniref:glutamate--tRNA ligase n=1 Tax=Neomegalonema perideroedes TaxID=217219 RepID=UPI000366579D|nr:glutamate--tRNA ligase [Neomegalonema perideroedes]